MNGGRETRGGKENKRKYRHTNEKIFFFIASFFDFRRNGIRNYDFWRAKAAFGRRG